MMDIIGYTLRDGGGTWRADSLQSPPVTFADGYVVAIGKPYAAIIPAQVFADYAGNVEALETDYLQVLQAACDVGYVGTWRDGDSVYLDAVAHVDTLAEAVRLGVERDQVAVWDCANACEVPTGGTGSVGPATLAEVLEAHGVSVRETARGYQA